MKYTKKVIGTVAYMGGVPMVFERFCKSWADMIQYNNEYLCDPGEAIFYTRSTVSYHAYARNELVEKMQGDWLLMLDTDHQFDPDLLARMLHTMNKYKLNILTGLYQYKMPPYPPVIYKFNEEQKLWDLIGGWSEDDECFQIDSSGGGVLLIRKKVFDVIKKELNEQPFDIHPPYSEDHSFFYRCRKLGIPVWCNPHIESNHLEIRPLNISHYDRDYFSKKEEFSVPSHKAS